MKSRNHGYRLEAQRRVVWKREAVVIVCNLAIVTIMTRGADFLFPDNDVAWWVMASIGFAAVAVIAFRTTDWVMTSRPVLRRVKNNGQPHFDIMVEDDSR